MTTPLAGCIYLVINLMEYGKSSSGTRKAPTSASSFTNGVMVGECNMNADVGDSEADEPG